MNITLQYNELFPKVNLHSSLAFHNSNSDIFLVGSLAKHCAFDEIELKFWFNKNALNAFIEQLENLFIFKLYSVITRADAVIMFPLDAGHCEYPDGELAPSWKAPKLFNNLIY